MDVKCDYITHKTQASGIRVHRWKRNHCVSWVNEFWLLPGCGGNWLLWCHVVMVHGTMVIGGWCGVLVMVHRDVV